MPLITGHKFKKRTDSRVISWEASWEFETPARIRYTADFRSGPAVLGTRVASIEFDAGGCFTVSDCVRQDVHRFLCRASEYHD